jgi:CRISPR-associated endoribonuclease Cas6
MKLSKYRFIIKPQKELILPTYKGSTFRGGFGHAFKSAVCAQREKECRECMLMHSCIYCYVFDTTFPGECEQDEHVPHPFIIEPPLDKRRLFGTEDRLCFDLILVGRAADYIPYFILAFEKLGEMGIGQNKGKYWIEKVTGLSKDREFLIYDGSSHLKYDFQVIDSAEIIHDAAQLNYHQVALRFLTPTRIKHNGKLTMNMEFEVVMRNLMRRLSWLARVHCGEKWEIGWSDIIRKAREVRIIDADLVWYDWERYSQRQGTRMKMGGFLGEIEFEGKLAEFMPWLKLGEYLHIGKGTVYGLGKYEIEGR